MKITNVNSLFNLDTGFAFVEDVANVDLVNDSLINKENKLLHKGT
jgi:hypothetical protein